MEKGNDMAKVRAGTPHFRNGPEVKDYEYLRWLSNEILYVGKELHKQSEENLSTTNLEVAVDQIESVADDLEARDLSA